MALSVRAPLVVVAIALIAAAVGCGGGSDATPAKATREACGQLAAVGETTPACSRLARRILRHRHLVNQRRDRHMERAYCAAIDSAGESYPGCP